MIKYDITEPKLLSYSHIFIFSIVIRTFQSFFTKTALAADEFWQGPEIAHNIVFGYGYK